MDAGYNVINSGVERGGKIWILIYEKKKKKQECWLILYFKLCATGCNNVDA